MVIKQLAPNEFDVFLGNGWENWLRVGLSHKTRQATVIKQSEHVETTPQLLTLIYFKIKRAITGVKNANGA